MSLFNPYSVNVGLRGRNLVKGGRGKHLEYLDIMIIERFNCNFSFYILAFGYILHQFKRGKYLLGKVKSWMKSLRSFLGQVGCDYL